MTEGRHFKTILITSLSVLMSVKQSFALLHAHTLYNAKDKLVINRNLRRAFTDDYSIQQR